MRPTMMPTILPRNALAAAIAALMLAGCATADSAHRASAAQAAPAQPSRGTAESAKAAAGSDNSLQQGGITRAKINAMCWMKYEKGRNDLPLDTRADLVNRCVGEALKRYHME